MISLPTYLNGIKQPTARGFCLLCLNIGVCVCVCRRLQFNQSKASRRTPCTPNWIFVWLKDVHFFSFIEIRTDTQFFPQIKVDFFHNCQQNGGGAMFFFLFLFRCCFYAMKYRLHLYCERQMCVYFFNSPISMLTRLRQENSWSNNSIRVYTSLLTPFNT